VDRYRFILGHRTRWRVGEMCRVLAVSRSGFYVWQKRDPSRRQQETERLDGAIKRLYQASRVAPKSRERCGPKTGLLVKTESPSE
jgi:putative transposase|tara:strand:+ start:940 stop:1194 length:255 start_codon:yes stop_codon:yes gene_type:complete